jgi:hypothetical protein
MHEGGLRAAFFFAVARRSSFALFLVRSLRALAARKFLPHRAKVSMRARRARNPRIGIEAFGSGVARPFALPWARGKKIRGPRRFGGTR